MSVSKITIVAVFAGLGLAAAAHGQIVFLGSYNGKDYFHNTTPLSWTAARTAALSFSPGQSDLIVFENAAEEDFLKTVIPPPNNGPNPWIGFTKQANPGGGVAAFQWVNGAPVLHTNWAGDANFAAGQDYASWNWSDPGRVWLALGDGGSPFGFKSSIIEVVPSPSAAALMGLGAIFAGRRRR